MYAARYAGKESCFNKKMFFPFSYRLYLKEECRTFFSIFKSEEYQLKKKTEPLQYLAKMGRGAHRGSGVWLLDEEFEKVLEEKYGVNGSLCGKNDKPMIIQEYISNPLLLDHNNKFDFRVYMLVASTNPTIVYYHDGFLRVSLSVYDKWSKDVTYFFFN